IQDLAVPTETDDAAPARDFRTEIGLRQPNAFEVFERRLTKFDAVVTVGEPPFEHLEGVWLAKSNLGAEVTSWRGVIRFGRYGQVLDFDFDPEMILAAGDATLRVTLDRELGEVTIASDFGRLADLGGESLDGPNSAIRVEASPHD
ncbi:MAG: hypothetical protein AAF663_06385, partial [Planctomycetota bacterium]